MSDTVTFEQPLNERIRTFMRVEELYARCIYYIDQDHQWDTHIALSTLIELYALVTRGDLKRELLKEINRQQTTLTHLAKLPDIDQSKLANIINQQASLVIELDNIEGPIFTNLKEHDFVNAIKQRMAIPGGTCDFDLPAYHFWLSHEPITRKRKLNAWLAPFEVIQKAVHNCLQLIRESTNYNECLAEAGFYQLSLDPQQPNQLIRVSIEKKYDCFPVISAGKHRISIRFLTHKNPDEAARQLKENIKFQLSCCNF